MSRLFYLVLLTGLITATAHAAPNTEPDINRHNSHSGEHTGTPNTTDTLNSQSLARVQRPQPAPPAKVPPISPDGTIAKGTGVIAPELLEAPVYNPADRR